MKPRKSQPERRKQENPKKKKTRKSQKKKKKIKKKNVVGEHWNPITTPHSLTLTEMGGSYNQE